MRQSTRTEDAAYEFTGQEFEVEFELHQISIVLAKTSSFLAEATAVVEFNSNGRVSIWAVDQTGDIVQKDSD
jgi:hypothetical protein